MSEKQTDSDTYLLIMAHAWNVQVFRLRNVSYLSLEPTKTLTEPATIVTKRTSLATEGDMPSPSYKRMEVIKDAMELRQEPEK